MWKFIVDVVHDFVSSLQPDVGRGFLHVSNVFLYILILYHTDMISQVIIQGRIQYLKLGVAQMDWKIWKPGWGEI